MLIATLLVATVLPHLAAPPRWLDTEIAGYVQQRGKKDLCVLDRSTGFFLMRGAECDSSIQYMVLTRDHHGIVGEQAEYTMPGTKESKDTSFVVRFQPLPRYTTGKGVAIGDGEDKVAELLGKPTRRKITGSRGQYIEYSYHWKSKDWEYTQAYTFKANKLIEIRFNKDATDL